MYVEAGERKRKMLKTVQQNKMCLVCRKYCYAKWKILIKKLCAALCNLNERNRLVEIWDRQFWVLSLSWWNYKSNHNWALKLPYLKIFVRCSSICIVWCLSLNLNISKVLQPDHLVLLVSCVLLNQASAWNVLFSGHGVVTATRH